MRKVFKISLALVLASTISYASKIVSVGGSITETIVAFGHQDDLIGVDLSSSYPKDLKSKLPNVGYWLSLPQEGILSLKPEIAIISSQAKPKKVVDNLTNYGIKTHIIEDKPSIDSAKRKILQIGKILGEDKKAEEIISRIDTNISKINEQIKGKNKPKVLFVFSRGKGTMMAAGPKTKPGVMIELAGGKNAVDFDQYSKISPESILKMNPDVIIKSNHAGDSGLDDKIVASTNAGKNGQIYSIDMLLISGFTVRVDSALQKLSCMLNNQQLSYCK
ncbi:ABC transporter substrate-binding protein [Halarcobacter sp.]|uniref:heme/hemin ABC transporter substrate-binding protein n=1 Tax=Halarcobacter sp. TaxID=2321133 RepID=UPI002AABF895|nr:ABC transporter substrate-binding protein [Halarcobacter sp.]